MADLEGIKKANKLISEIRSLQMKAFAFIAKTSMTRDGESLSLEDLDQFQEASYELAFVSAEISAAEAFIGRASQLDSLVNQMALCFMVEILNRSINRFLRISQSVGLDDHEITNFYGNSDYTALRSKYGSLEFVASLGSKLCSDNVIQLSSNLSAEKDLMKTTFKRFADEIVMPIAESIHREDLDIPDEILVTAAELGCFGTCIPERFGGLQPDDKPDSLSMIIVTEELSRGSLGAAGSLITRPEIAARALLSGGTEQQKIDWLPRLASGQTLCAISITEPNTGSDVSSVNLRASPTEGGWILNGAKTWCTFAARSELLVVLARTESNDSLGHKGLSLFLVEKPAFEGRNFIFKNPVGGELSGRSISTLGYRGMHSFDLNFDEFFVSAEALVGGENGRGKGFYYTMSGFSGGRIQTAARATGVMQSAYEHALRYASERATFGRLINEYQLIQIKLARILMFVEASRAFSHRVAQLMDEGEGQMEASLVKLFSCRAAEYVTREAQQIFGGMGYAEEVAVSRLFVDARVLSIFEGAEEVLALKVVARGYIDKAFAELKSTECKTF